jgi:hypothetical protein
MKTRKTTSAVLLMIFIFSGIGMFAQCREINIDHMTKVLKGFVEPSLKITLDRDNSRLSLLGYTQNFTLPAESISKAGRDWSYFVQDVRSDDSNLYFDKNRNDFVLDVRFEGEGSEIKGICPGCIKMSRDSRAPDLNWKGARIARLRFRPVPFEGSISLEVTSVELFGEFDLNGILDTLFPRMVRNMENKIKREIQNNALVILNKTDVKRSIAEKIRPVLSAMGITHVRSVSQSPDKKELMFCR